MLEVEPTTARPPLVAQLGASISFRPYQGVSLFSSQFIYL